MTDAIHANLLAAHVARTGELVELQAADDVIAAARAKGSWKVVAELWTDVAKLAR